MSKSESTYRRIVRPSILSIASCLFAEAFLSTRPVQAVSLPADQPKTSRIFTLDDVPMINPADEAHHSASTQPAESAHMPPSELPAVTVVGESNPSALKDDESVGTYAQPRWTVDRRFPGVRTYVIPENAVEFEYWTRVDVARHGSSEVQHMFELEFGLPSRFQLDLYAIARTETGGNSRVHFDQQIELRYAFADYGKLWGNPTLYLEYANRDEAVDKIETKLLISGTLAPGWHWGQNFLFEGETGGEREYEYGWTGGLSYTLADQKLSVGVESQFSLFDVKDHRGSYRDETFLGPSVQFRPVPRMHLDFAPLIGVDHESPAAKLFFVFGYEF